MRRILRTGFFLHWVLLMFMGSAKLTMNCTITFIAKFLECFLHQFISLYVTYTVTIREFNRNSVNLKNRIQFYDIYIAPHMELPTVVVQWAKGIKIDVIGLGKFSDKS